LSTVEFMLTNLSHDVKATFCHLPSPLMPSGQ